MHLSTFPVPVQFGLLAVLLGLTSHLTLFIQEDWHMVAPLLIWVYTALFFGLNLFLNIFEADLRICLKKSLILVLLYCIGILTSVIVCRLYLHRLHSCLHSKEAQDDDPAGAV